MRQFQFTKGDIQVTVKCDLIDAKAQHMTIMEIRGGKGTEFESIFPWKQGATLYRQELIAWFNNYSAAWTGYEYGGAEVVALNDADAVKTMTIVPTITNGNKADLKIICKNSSGYTVGEEVVNLNSGTNKTVDVVLGFTYGFGLVGANDSWTSGSAPSEIEVDGNESVNIGITIPNTSASYKMTLQPTIAGADSAKISVTGTKSGYANDVHAEVVLGSENVEIDVLDGYSYAFAILTANGSWTSGSAPDAVVINKSNATVAIGITVAD